MALLICPECSKQISDTCKECPRCGTDLLQYRRCRECGALVEKTSEQCPNCGFDFVAADAAAAEAYAEAEKERRSRRCSNCINYNPDYASHCCLRNGFLNSLKTFDATTCPDYCFNTAKRKTGSFCFLTTACVEYYGKPDDCYELETLRSFRDGILMKTEKGRRLCMEYYEIAPMIVERMKEDGDSAVYEWIYGVILECIAFIQQEKYREATDRYKEMVLTLKGKYLANERVCR